MAAKFETAILQNEAELNLFIATIQDEKIASYLEIGSKHGGSLWHIGRSLRPGARIVAVDLPHGDASFKESEPHLKHCVATLKQRGYDTHLILGDSTDPVIIAQARALGPYDLCFIDANHTEPYVRADWKNYGPMARMVAFHDIGWIPRPEPSKKLPIEVPKVWKELKTQYRTREIRMCPRDNGIGILWKT